MAEPFLGQFELKTLDSEPGSFEFQSQNAWAWGHPSRRVASDGEDVVFDENAAVRARHALELEIGLTSRLKTRIGIEFENERFDEPTTIEQANDFEGLRLTEVGAEIIAVLLPRESDGAGFGVVMEIEGPLGQEEPNDLVLGGIVEFQSGRWFIAAVPMLVHAFGGDTEEGQRRDDKWDFAYATQVAYTFSESWSLALEGYGTIERLGSSGHPSEAAEIFGDSNQHRVGPVLYYTHGFGSTSMKAQSALSASTGEGSEGASLSIGLGLLAGLNGDTADRTLKLSLEVDF